MRRNNNRKLLVPDKGQKKITQFFGRQGDTTASQTPVPSPAVRQRPRRWIDDGDYTEVEVLPTPPPKPVIFVDLENDESPPNPQQQSTSTIVKMEPVTPVKQNVPIPSTSTAVPSTAVAPSSPPSISPESHQEEKSPQSASSPILFPDENSNMSSGDEVLSQIDIDEIIRSSQSSLNNSPVTSPTNKENHHQPQLLSFSQQNNVFKSPQKVSPKSQLTKFSPRRHLNNNQRLKRTSSEASLDAATITTTASTSSSQQSSPSKRRLNFGQGQARYFLRNFLSILTEVVSDPFHSDLLSSEDHHLVQDFVSLSLDAQHLYVRLFQRKWIWRPTSKLNNNNKELPSDLSDCLSELLSKRFLEEISQTNCGSLEELLDILDLPKMTNLAKKMKLSAIKKTKEGIKEALIGGRTKQRTLTGSGASEAALIKHALAELGSAYRVTEAQKVAFGRLFLLYSPPQYWEVENDQAANQLLIVLLSQMGQMSYPEYVIDKQTKVWKEREDLLRFQEAFQLHSQIVGWTQVKDWEEVAKLAEEAVKRFKQEVGNTEVANRDKELPEFLRVYTPGSVLAHAVWMGVDGWLKGKRWKEATEVIREVLLAQNVYLKGYRGRWWERVVINLETHLKKGKEEVKQVLEMALTEEGIKVERRLALGRRLEKVREWLEKKKGKRKAVVKPKKVTKGKGQGRGRGRRVKYVDDSEEETEDEEIGERVSTDEVVTLEEEDDLQEAAQEVQILRLEHTVPVRTITGEKLDQGPGAMGKSVFISRDSAGGTQMGSVEQFVINYYLDEHGYSSGLHGEGSSVVSIFGLLFWDVIFCEGVADAFWNKFQGYPLDMHFGEEFYSRREDMIKTKLLLIREVLRMSELEEIVDRVWRENVGKLSVVSWEAFGEGEEGLQRLKGLMKALGRKGIGDICERLAGNYRQWRSGFPDLVVWKDGGEEGDEEEDGREGKVLFVEVKGPGDSLSEKQQLWLDFLVGRGIAAEVCHVKAVSNKRIRLTK